MTHEETAEELTFCAVHPDRETGLRCNKCNRYMCAQCAVQTPVGYRCRECVRRQDDKFFTATSNDAVIIGGVCAGLSLIAGAVFGALGGLGLWVAIILSFPVGGAIAEVALRAIQKRRGRSNARIGAAGVVIGGLIGAAVRAYLAYPDEYREFHRLVGESGGQIPPALLELYPTLSTYVMNNIFTFGVIIYVAMAAYAVYYRMKS